MSTILGQNFGTHCSKYNSSTQITDEGHLLPLHLDVKVPGEFRDIDFKGNRTGRFPYQLFSCSWEPRLLGDLSAYLMETLGSQQYHPRGMRAISQRILVLSDTLAVPHVGAPENLPANNPTTKGSERN